MCVLGQGGRKFAHSFAFNGAFWETAACCHPRGAGRGLVPGPVCTALAGVLGWRHCPTHPSTAQLFVVDQGRERGAEAFKSTAVSKQNPVFDSVS